MEQYDVSDHLQAAHEFLTAAQATPCLPAPSAPPAVAEPASSGTGVGVTHSGAPHGPPPIASTQGGEEEDEALSGMSVADLRGVIGQAGLSCHGLVEKAELRERAREARALLRAEAERAGLFGQAGTHFNSALRLARSGSQEERAARAGLRKSRDGARRADLMAEAEQLLSSAAAVETRDDQRQAMFARARNLFQRVRDACPNDFAARRGVDTASSGKDVEQLIADGVRELHAPLPPSTAGEERGAAAAMQWGQSAEVPPPVPWGGQPALVSTEPAIIARRQRLYKAATFFLSAQKLDPQSVHAARRVGDLCRATGLAITDELLLRWDSQEVQDQLAAAERAQEIERVRSAHLRTISANAWPDVRGDGSELRVFWSNNELPRFALREWQHVRTAAARDLAAGNDGSASGSTGGARRGTRRRLTQHATLDQLCSLTRSGEVQLIKCGDGWIRLSDGLTHPRASVPSGVVEVLDVGAARGAEPSVDVEWLGQMLLDAICRHMPKTPVTLNVYDLGTQSEPGSGTIGWVANRLPGLNSVLRSVVGGAFHGALEIDGTEYSFGWNDLEQTGVFECPDRQNEMHRFREAVPLGHTRFGEKEIEWLIAGELAGRWPGSGYDLLRRNCCHFCEEFAELLGVQSLPPWMNSLANTGASLASTADKLAQFKEDLTRERSGDGGGSGND